MQYTVAFALAAFTGLASARQCKNLTVPVDISARNGNFNQKITETDIEVTNFILNQTQNGHNYSMEALDGYNTIAGTYNIAATYCEPDNGPANVLQVLTHGIGFDRSYWDVPFNYPNYSYVADAVDQQGYSTFSWDRLGIGMSDRGDPVQEIQAYLEVDALRALTEQLRGGEISDISKAFDKVVHVGHSFGAEHSYLLSAMYPNISDGIVLTGFSATGDYLPYFALGGNFVDGPNAGLDYQHGYLAAGGESGVQTNFFSPGSFPPEFLTFATTNGQPVTLGELLTIGGEINVPNTYCGPVLVITGERDVPYCGGDCTRNVPEGYSSIPAAAQESFPNTQIDTVIVADAGHGLNFEYSHEYTYAQISDFLSANGLSADSTSGSTLQCQPGAGGDGGSSASATATATGSGSSASATQGQGYGPGNGWGHGWGNKGGDKGHGWANKGGNPWMSKHAS